MDIYLHNTLSGEKELFKPIKKGLVSMYHCGPTVYDTPHIGNYRTFIMNDLIRRAFEYNQYEVNQVMNITDVDDKTINKSREEKVPLKNITQRYEKLFLEGLDCLNILRPTSLVRATEHIADMIRLIEILRDKDFAYRAEDGVYMRVDKIKNYGSLARLDLSHAGQTHERIANDEYDKEKPHDFALWKFKSPEDGDIFWNASFGQGRPGWHIECSAMAMKELGPTLDIHTGGIDLVFPHHTNEIAQSESATGKTFARYWIHGAFMTINREKMAKSKNNVIKLDDLKKESISPLSYRYWLMTAHHRSLVDFSYNTLHAAQTGLIRLIKIVASYPDGGTIIPDYQQRFQTFINDDLDLPQALALAWELIKDGSYSAADKKASLLDFDRVFGLKLASAPRAEYQDIPAEIQALGSARQQARLEKDWAKADALRAEIEARGFVVSDTPEGMTIIAV
ncbi:MAG: cysteine--tRNA ligase [Candidatus Taylorbacteria bacterium RIFCSPLOWO2_01_FULL_44_26]|uniref:Cysteine--tRNA ligase n=2 Tax=Candidatus Tayloriibacteriota TaxID=1817919 RepID=A0A1G2ML85_9BACT|nr:MAG: cysteine--tRNA ligase [Candidatus Taylorbacteria bacterium RIFCSPHIGHO2_02_FULL_44_12]OHA31427.1 MAG: cysteine--tRNA ligase [Candidatus Taylorbacteria bacterium RIFCSPLOWO2_01_FULL_44_26]